MLCLPCALTVADALTSTDVPDAIAVGAGRSVCGQHPLTSDLPAGGCVRCGRHAWFVSGGQPWCVRHVADELFLDDDMAAHDLAHAAYLALNARGIAGAY